MMSPSFFSERTDLLEFKIRYERVYKSKGDTEADVYAARSIGRAQRATLCKRGVALEQRLQEELRTMLSLSVSRGTLKRFEVDTPYIHNVEEFDITLNGQTSKQECLFVKWGVFHHRASEGPRIEAYVAWDASMQKAVNGQVNSDKDYPSTISCSPRHESLREYLALFTNGYSTALFKFCFSRHQGRHRA
ncbi:MAG: hypothetical protein Q9159_005938 [Coniocarpon cinnabarinum]